MILNSWQQLLIFLYFFILGAVFAPIFASQNYLFEKYKAKHAKLKEFFRFLVFVLSLVVFCFSFFILMIMFNYGVFRYYMVLSAIAGFFIAIKTIINPLAFISFRIYNFIRSYIKILKGSIKEWKKERAKH